MFFLFTIPAPGIAEFSAQVAGWDFETPKAGRKLGLKGSDFPLTGDP